MPFLNNQWSSIMQKSFIVPFPEIDLYNEDEVKLMTLYEPCNINHITTATIWCETVDSETVGGTRNFILEAIMDELDWRDISSTELESFSLLLDGICEKTSTFLRPCIKRINSFGVVESMDEELIVQNEALYLSFGYSV